MVSILLVEDEKSTVALLTRSLTKAGHTVTAAETGEDGLIKAKATPPPQLILMDMGLPGISGFEAIRKLKADPATKTIPILALTGAVTSGDRDEAYEAGCDAYATKPIDLALLAARVKELTGS